MSLFNIIKPAIHALPPETAHNMSIAALRRGLVPPQPVYEDARLHITLAGIDLPNPVGLAPGFDKNAHTLPHIFSQGFGFVECGTVTPKAQAGNPKPRVFRLGEQEAVVNQLGFNNNGLDEYVKHLKDYNGAGIVGANIGKNKTSDDAVADYVACAKAVYEDASYITVNISSPNTQGLRALQESEQLGGLIGAVQRVRDDAMQHSAPYKPIFVKIAPDLDEAQIEAIAGLAVDKKVDALIVSNTTITRPNGLALSDQLKQGGLSGKPLMELSTAILKRIAQETKGQVPLIGVGGIASADDAYAKIKAGASAVQLYSALVYQGFDLITQIKRGLVERLERDGVAQLSDVVGVAN